MSEAPSGAGQKTGIDPSGREGSGLVTLRTPPVESQEPLRLSVRQARLRDLPALIRPPKSIALGLPEAPLVSLEQVRVTIGGAIPIPRSRARCFVAVAGDRIVGYLEMRPVPPDRRWQGIAIGAAAGVFDPGPVWEELLRHATVAAGVRGVKRLYAKVPSGSEALEAFRRAGFAAYANETLFTASNIQPRSEGVRLRPQEPSDTWAIHQLYNAAVPRQVQYAEAFTSHRWDIGRGRSGCGGSWILDEGHLIIGHARVTPHGNDLVLELIHNHERLGDLGAFIDGVLSRMQAYGNRPRVSIAVRGYQGELARELELRGFRPVLEQDVLVRYTTAQARLPQTESIPFHSEVIERLPKRVPSYLHGPRRDESRP